MKKEYLSWIWFPIVSYFLLSYGVYIDYKNLSPLSSYTYWKLFTSFGASFCGILFVTLEIRKKTAMFFIGILGSSCSFIYLLLWSPLIWDLSLVTVNLVLGIYGLYNWTYDSKEIKKSSEITISTLSCIQIRSYTIFASLGILILSIIGIKMGKYTSYPQAIADAITTSLGVLGQWFLSRKILETWYLWIIINFISIFLYMSIGSYIYTIKYFCYFIASFIGLVSWKKSLYQRI